MEGINITLPWLALFIVLRLASPRHLSMSPLGVREPAGDLDHR